MSSEWDCDVTQPAPVDEAQARALGFDAEIDRMLAPLDLPFQWRPRKLYPDSGSPALGYTPTTRLLVTVVATGFQHLPPAMAGCEARLIAKLAVALQTADGALSISGELTSRPFPRGASAPMASGLLNLRDAHGSLELAPSSGSEPIDGQLGTAIYFWPDGSRVSLAVSMSPSGGPAYQPLDGAAPIDACGVYQRPFAIDAPGPVHGTSLQAVFPELRDWLKLGQPLPALWLGGESTSVRVQLGEPFDLCADEYGTWTYQVPLSVSSDDGRAHIQHAAKGRLTFRDGTWYEGGVDFTSDVIEAVGDSPDAALDSATFAELSGLEGVDFGTRSKGSWWVGVGFGKVWEPPAYGYVGVQSHFGNYVNEVERLDW